MSRIGQFGRVAAGRQRYKARSRRGRGFWRHPVQPLSLIVAVAAIAYAGSYIVAPEDFLATAPRTQTIGAPISAHFELCGAGTRVTCVVDGDTVWIKGDKIRIADIDTPEVFSPKCAAERQRGEEATRRLQQLLNAGPIELARYDSRDTDVYDRTLRVIQRDGQSLGAVLVAEGLARRWDGARRGWC